MFQPCVLPSPRPLTLSTPTSQESLAVEVLHLEAAQLGQQGKEAAKLLQHAHAALQHRAVQPQGRAHPGRLCQPAVCLLLGQSQIELWGRGTPAAGDPPTPTPENASHPGRGAKEGVSTLAKAMHFHSLMFSEMTRYRCQMCCCCTMGRVPQTGKGTGLSSPVGQAPGVRWGHDQSRSHNDRREGPESAGDEAGGGGQCPKLFSTINQGRVSPGRETLGKRDRDEREGILFY